MSQTPTYIESAEVARLLGFEGKRPGLQFLARRSRLEAQGFPQPLSWTASPLKWDRAAVEAWIAAARRLAAEGAQPRVEGAEPNDAAFARAMAGRAGR